MNGTASTCFELVDWIGEDGGILGTVSRAEMRRRNLLHEVTATFVFHPEGRLFVHQRTFTKDVYPGHFDLCVGGTVTSGELPVENAMRELEEELGVRGVTLHPLFTHRFQDVHTNSRVHVFACVFEGPFRFQTEEVLDGAWREQEAIEPLIATAPVCPDSAQGWRLYIERCGRDRTFANVISLQLEQAQGE